MRDAVVAVVVANGAPVVVVALSLAALSAFAALAVDFQSLTCWLVVHPHDTPCLQDYFDD